MSRKPFTLTTDLDHRRRVADIPSPGVTPLWLIEIGRQRQRVSRVGFVAARRDRVERVARNFFR